MHARIRILVGLTIALWCAILIAVGCGGADTAAAGTSGTGGRPGSGGATGTGGAGQGGHPSSGCPGYPGQDPSKLPGAGCCAAGPSHCVATSSIPPGLSGAFATCAEGLCVPDPVIQKGSDYVPTTCTADVFGTKLEGACLSECITFVATNPQKSLLKQATCGMGELCVPCINPLDMQPTGACSIADLVCGKDAGADSGNPDASGPTCPYTGPPIIDPSGFPACSPTCAGAHCLPAALVPIAEQSQLAACAGGFCAPDTFIETAGAGLPKTCTSIAGVEGRCLSTCLPAIAEQASLLPLDVCTAGEKCAPCFNPVAADPKAPTGACSLACDKPAKPATVLTCPWKGPPVLDPSALPQCDGGGCGGAHCLPSALVPAAVQSQLASCSNNTGFCAPDPIISTGNNFIPTSCDPFPGSGAAGRCLSDCLPAVKAQEASGTIVQATCGASELCVPCNDPFTGTPTGACSLGCDAGPSPPFAFPKCCNDGNGSLTGTCVPSAQVPAAQQSSVNQSGNGNSAPCPASGAKYVCIPDEYLPAPYNKPPLQFCEATFFNLCGTCVSQCIVNGNLGVLGPDDCAANHKCVPCSLAASTPGCPEFCTGNAVCGNSCGCDADCQAPCGVCSGGSNTCGDGSGTCDTK